MAVSLALDIGKKRTGVAITDPFGCIAFGLETVETDKLISYLQRLIEEKNISYIVMGIPVGLRGEETDATQWVKDLAEKIKARFPTKKYAFVDERFTSKIAQQTLIQSGKNKKQRQNKPLTDKVSAVLILQSWLESQPK